MKTFNKTSLAILSTAVSLLLVFWVARIFNEQGNVSDRPASESATKNPRSESISEASDRKAVSRQQSEHVEKNPEEWVKRMTADRPGSFQKVLDAPPGEPIHFGDPVRMRILDGAKLKNLPFETQDLEPASLSINGESFDASRFIYIRGDARIAACRIRGKSIDVRVLEFTGKKTARLVGHLPPINYNESRRWWIPDWYMIDKSSFLGFSLEEDAKSEEVLTSHFYIYHIPSKTLSTLVIPSGVSPYQQLTVIGINRKTKTIKVSDAAGNILYFGY